MTVEEKSDKIFNWCSNRFCDSSCPLYAYGNRTCYTINNDADKKQIEENYKILFGSESNNVNHPSHYQGKHECIDEMIAMFGVEAVKGFCKCNVYKYRYRAAEKNGQEDLDKANWYMDKLMELEGELV